MPPPMACCRLLGIHLMMYFRSFVTVIRILRTPQINTMDSACCQVKPRPKQTVYTKKAFNPMPGACAYGTFATSPMTSVPMMAAMIVARNTAPHSMPA